jgi:hypothetical protein
LYQKRNNVLGLRKRKLKKYDDILSSNSSSSWEDVSLSQTFRLVFNTIFHSFLWHFFVVILTIMIIIICAYYEYVWWENNAVSQLQKGMNYLDGNNYPYKMELPKERLYIHYNQEVHQYTKKC